MSIELKLTATGATLNGRPIDLKRNHKSVSAMIKAALFSKKK